MGGDSVDFAGSPGDRLICTYEGYKGIGVSIAGGPNRHAQLNRNVGLAALRPGRLKVDRSEAVLRDHALKNALSGYTGLFELSCCL